MDASSKFSNNLPTQPKDLLNFLQNLGVKYQLFEHKPLFTVAQSQKFRQGMEGFHVKNLYLRDKRKRSFLIVAQEDCAIDLKNLPEKLGSSRLSFGSNDRLFEKLGVFPGAVTPLSLINNKEKDVSLFLDKKIRNKKKIFCHPLVNDKTLSISYQDLNKFFNSLEIKINFINL